MRDWNWNFSSSSFNSAPGFQHTYEGLKPLPWFLVLLYPGKFSAYLWGIETMEPHEVERRVVIGFQHTYEGLKHGIGQLFVCNNTLFSAYLWGIETHQIASSPPGQAPVFSIPMRDWNCHPHIVIVYTTAAFSAYLWGIETQIPGCASPW